MLVLTRGSNEQIIIADTIRITILAIGNHGQVKVGIEAPRDIPIVRAELLTRQAPDDPQHLVAASVSTHEASQHLITQGGNA